MINRFAWIINDNWIGNENQLINQLIILINRHSISCHQSECMQQVMNITTLPNILSHTASEDYISTSVVATFTKGASTATIKVPIIDDNQFECDEFFQAALSVPGDITGVKVTKGTKDEAQVTIKDKGEAICYQSCLMHRLIYTSILCTYTCVKGRTSKVPQRKCF